jgi:hypothetical protein
MPYLTKERQDELLAPSGYPTTGGDLNFILTKLCLEFAGDSPRYETFNTIVGALESCKLEFYRRAVAGYEDKKIEQNGDIYK